MLYKMLIAITALVTPLSAIQIDDHQFIIQTLTASQISKTCSCKLRGPIGPKGPTGPNGQVIVSSVYADALFLLPEDSEFITFNTNDPIIFTQVTRANGVNTTTPGSFIIESEGDYLITYYINGTNPGFGSIYIALVLNGSPVEESRIGTRLGSTIIITLSGETILHLVAGDVLQLAPDNGSTIITLSSPSDQPLKIASLTIEKVNL